jgi:hypothetical protein
MSFDSQNVANLLLQIQDRGSVNWTQEDLAILADIKRRYPKSFRKAFAGWHNNAYASFLLGKMMSKGVELTDKKRQQKAERQRIKEYVLAHPEETYTDIAPKFGFFPTYLAELMRDMGVRRKKKLTNK